MNYLDIKLFSKEFRIPVRTQAQKELWSDIQDGSWEPETLKLINYFVTEKSIALDVGGSVGETTIFLGSKAKSTVAIDPSPYSIECLQEIIDCNKELGEKLFLLEGALSDKDEMLFFGQGSDHFSDIHFGVNKFNKYVKGLTIDSISEQYGLIFTFINIDIEGGEYRCLPSMKKYFKINAPDLLISLHPGFNAKLFFFRSNYFFVLKLIWRIFWNIRILRSVWGYEYCVDVSRRSVVSKWALLMPRFLSGKNGNQCQLFFTNTFNSFWD
jgi:FkbM family methyltransferase